MDYRVIYPENIFKMCTTKKNILEKQLNVNATLCGQDQINNPFAQNQKTKIKMPEKIKNKIHFFFERYINFLVIPGFICIFLRLINKEMPQKKLEHLIDFDFDTVYIKTKPLTSMRHFNY